MQFFLRGAGTPSSVKRKALLDQVEQVGLAGHAFVGRHDRSGRKSTERLAQRLLGLYRAVMGAPTLLPTVAWHRLRRLRQMIPIRRLNPQQIVDEIVVPIMFVR